MLTNAVTNLSSIMACKPTLSVRCYCHELITCSLSSVVRQTTELLPIADFYRSQLGAPLGRAGRVRAHVEPRQVVELQA